MRRLFPTLPVPSRSTHRLLLGVRNPSPILFALPLHTPPLHGQRPHRRETRRGQSDRVRVRQRPIVRHQHRAEVSRGDQVPDLGRPRVHHVERIQPRHAAQAGDQAVGEDRLRDGDEHGAAERLREEHQRGPDRDVAPREHRLRGQVRLLHPQAEADAEDDLVGDPRGGAGVRAEGGQQAGADAHERGAEEHERGVVADGGDAGAGGDAGDDEGEHQRQGADAGLDGRDGGDGLEPDGEVEDHDDHGGAEAEGEAEPRGHAALLEDAGGDGGGFLLVALHEDEGGGEEEGEDEEGDDPPVGPRVGGAAPLESEEQADDGGEEEEVAEGVELEEFLPQGGAGGFLSRESEDQDDDHDRQGADGEVHVEAPSPEMGQRT